MSILIYLGQVTRVGGGAGDEEKGGVVVLCLPVNPMEEVRCPALRSTTGGKALRSGSRKEWGGTHDKAEFLFWSHANGTNVVVILE